MGQKTYFTVSGLPGRVLALCLSCLCLAIASGDLLGWPATLPLIGDPSGANGLAFGVIGLLSLYSAVRFGTVHIGN